VVSSVQLDRKRTTESLTRSRQPRHHTSNRHAESFYQLAVRDVYALVPLAATARLKGEDAWAAKVLGTKDAIAERSGGTAASMWIQQLRERVEQEARGRLGLTEWTRAYESGRTVSIDSLLNDLENIGSSRMPR